MASLRRAVEMRCHQSLGLCLSVAALIVSLIARAGGGPSSPRDEAGSGNFVSLEGCLSPDALSAAIRTLSFGRFEDQQKTLALLKADANRTATCRKQVIMGLVSAMDQPNLDLTGGQPQFFLWHYGTRLLGELKALEAMDLLIANFDLDDGTPFPFNHHPALGGVIDMGEIALPKLQAVLKENPHSYTRQYAVFCIALIGGQSAHQILTQALKDESDPCVASCIRNSLWAFDNKRRPHHISDERRTTWYSTFQCEGK